MAGSGTGNPPQDAVDVKRTFDVPVRMRVRGHQDIHSATLLHIAISGSRLRSTLRLDRGMGVSFEWRLSNGRPLIIAGVVAAQYPSKTGEGYEYAIALEPMPEADADALVREAEQLVRSASAKSYDTALVDISQFLNYRVPDDVTVSYRIDQPRTFGIGRACDVTGKALRFWCTESLRPGQDVHLSMRLPDVVLNVHKGPDDELVTTPMGSGQVPRKMLRKPFQEIQVSGRVSAVVKDSKRRDAYEVDLLDLNPIARQEIARYIHASQLARLKR